MCARTGNPVLLPSVQHARVQLLRALKAHEGAAFHGSFPLAQVSCDACCGVWSHRQCGLRRLSLAVSASPQMMNAATNTMPALRISCILGKKDVSSGAVARSCEMKCRASLLTIMVDSNVYQQAWAIKT